MGTHLEESLQRDITRIHSHVTRMGDLAERAVQDAVRALREKNRQLAYEVVLRDQRINELEKEVDRLCLEFLVRQQPAGTHLRFAYSTIRLNLELERVGDYADSIARQALKLMPLQVPIPLDRLEEIANLSVPMLHAAVTAFVQQDAELARRTIATEEAVDVLKSQLNKDLVTFYRESKIPFEALNPLTMISRRLERVSDQARNICIEVIYMCTGEFARHRAGEVHRLLFVDEHNSCRSQMAEAIANSLDQPKFLFSSAGIQPQPITGATSEFLRSKGLETAQLTPKAVEQIPNLEHYHVIIGLAKEAQQAFRNQQSKAPFLDWNVDDPSRAEGSASDINSAYEQTYSFLREHITDLVNAVLGDQDR